MSMSVALFRKLETVDPSIREVLFGILEEIEKQQKERVTKDDFNELKDVLAGLLEAHNKAEERLTKLEVSIGELTEAQKHSEERLTRLENSVGELSKKVNELAEAQKQAEERLTRLEKSVERLTEFQKQAEERLTRLEKSVAELTKRVNELTEAQKKTDERLTRLEITVAELAEAQKRTEQEISKLVKRMDVFEDRLEGISHSVGYLLENRAYMALPKILYKKHGIKVVGNLFRRYFPVGKKSIQLNIYGHGQKNGDEYVIIGECKVRPSKREISRFKKYAPKIAEMEGKKPFYLFVAHDFPPEIEEFLNMHNIAYVWSYEFERGDIF